MHGELDVGVEEWDILNGQSFDLLSQDNRKRLLAAISSGHYDAILMSPPCGTWSRAPWANQFGPRPLRTSSYPWGFPWLEGDRQQKVAASNSMVRLCIDVLELIETMRFTLFFWLEHPEDLGAVATYRRKKGKQWFHQVDSGVRPASIWQLPELRRFLQLPGAITRAFHQCFFKAESPKPTRVLTNLDHFERLGFASWPELDMAGNYVGPLPRHCQCGQVHQQLIAKNNQGNFVTSEAAAYPPAMDEYLATALWLSFQKPLASSTLKRAGAQKHEEEMSKNQDSGQQAHEDMEKKEDSGGTQVPMEEKAASKKRPATVMGSHEMRGPGPKRSPFKLAPLQVWYKGKMRRMADGLGKCSPGIRPAGSRGLPQSSSAVRLADAFWQEVENLVDSWSREERLKIIAKISLGKFDSSPFGSSVEAMRTRLDGVVRSLGKDPSRKEGDRDTEFNFRRLRAWSELVEDEDDRYLSSLASKGVPLGARKEIGRIPAAYDSKGKDDDDRVPSEWDEDFEQSRRDNYSSATSRIEMVRSHVEEDIKKGWVAAMSLRDAQLRYGEELQIASLGAVPKDQLWSDVRVVHDGTHGIQVNTKISQPNRMEFPQFDDLQAALGAFKEAAPLKKLLVAFDIKAAHRLIPVQEQDWGLQAFRLDKEEEIYVNRVGTFGITTASFWWGRVASTLFRTYHRVLPRDALIYLLLFADDGLVMAGGDNYHKLALSVFIFLEVMEVPLSWKKTRGGFKTEWIGYTVDIGDWKIGVSARKVEWLRDWVKATNKEGRVLGREFKAGIGRMGFLAGAIKGARPFLAPLYAVASRVGNTSFVELHMAVKIAMEFFLDWLESEPMKLPAPPPGVAGEVFRVDAMASEQGICIGGWETYESSDPSLARWFSVELSRSNCPWLYIRGEPHRTIAASELLAVTLAVILFGPSAKWRNKHGRLVLSGFTDNASNSYLIDKYLSVKFPVSMVLMELSRQLGALGAELQLHWIPREQNEESDDLSKGRLDAFNPKLRVEAKLEDLPWMVIPKLVQHAMEFDKEIQLKKSSSTTTTANKAGMGRTPPEERLRLKQPW